MIRAFACALALVSFMAIACWSGVARADVHRYAIVVGNNAPPARAATDEPLVTLKYADDDAAAVYSLLHALDFEASLLTVLDARSQSRFPDLAAVARPPSLAALRQTISALKPRFEADVAQGHEPVLWFFFSGHGARPRDGAPSLAFIDGPMTQDVLYEEVLAALPARYVHLVIDACYAESVVRPRDGEAGSVALSASDLQRFAERTTLARFPHVGALIASATSARAFEWDALERGVFTHVLLSGLRGGADVNGDGLVEYSEIYAFLTAANREVADPRARLSVVAHAPPIHRRAPLVALDVARVKGGELVGAPGAMGRVTVEDERGNRVLDVHAERYFQVSLRIPTGLVYIQTPRGESSVQVKAGDRVALDRLTVAAPTTRARGAVEGALDRGIFAAPFGPSYYRAFMDGQEDLAPVPVREPALSPERSERKDEPRPSTALWASAGAAGAFAITTAVFGGLTLSAKHDYEATAIEREAEAARSRFDTARTLTIVSGAVTLAAAGVTTWLALTRHASSHAK